MREPSYRARQTVRVKRWAAWRLLRAADRLAARQSSTSDQVLLVAQNRLMADYVLRLWRCVADLHNGGVALTAYEGLAEDERATLETDGIAVVTPRWAQRRRWRALLLADHAPLQYLPSIPRVIVAHGVARARHVREGSYYYDGPRLFWPDGRPVYGVMLDASQASVDWARRRFPEYADRIVVTGDLRVDELLDQAAGADRRRRSLGWEGRTVVGILSTWSAGALVPSVGDWLVEHMRRLVDTGRYAAVFTMHPNLWNPSRCGTERWVRLLDGAAGEGVYVVRPEEDWAPALAMADCVVTDHTSLAATWSVLRRPIIPIEVPPHLVGEGTFARWLLNSRRPIRDADDLDCALADLTPYANFAGAPPIVDHVGEAAAHTRAALAPFVGA